MLTGLFFLAGLFAFVYICWWTYLNDRPGASPLPKFGFLAMISPAEEAEEAQAKKAPAWKRKGSTTAAIARNERQRIGR